MRVMVIGASSIRAKYGNKALRAYMRQGHEAVPVNPFERNIEGQPVFAKVTDVPSHVDRALFYVPPEVGLQVIEELHERGEVDEVWLNPGAESPELIDRARELGFEPILSCAIIDIGERP